MPLVFDTSRTVKDSNGLLHQFGPLVHNRMVPGVKKTGHIHITGFELSMCQHSPRRGDLAASGIFNKSDPGCCQSLRPKHRRKPLNRANTRAVGQFRGKSQIGDDMVAGAAASILTNLALHPLDTIRTHLQANSIPPHKVVSAIVSSKGIRGLYSGLGSTLIFSAPLSALYLSSYELIKGAVLKYLPVEFESAADVTAAVAANMATGLVGVPGEVLKNHTQLCGYASGAQAFNSILSRYGIGGFYRGYWMSLVKAIPSYAFRFGVYENARRAYSTWQGRYTEPWEDVVLGTLVGGAAMFVTAPIDTVRTRLVCHPAGIQAVLSHLMHTEGPSAFYKGMPLRLSCLIPSTFLFYGVFEAVRTGLRERRSRLAHAED